MLFRIAPLWLFMAVCGSALADSRCNCSTKLGKCDARVKLDGGRVEGNTITMDCSNWLNNVRYAGRLVSPTRISGTYTQATSSETCSWNAAKQ